MPFSRLEMIKVINSIVKKKILNSSINKSESQFEPLFTSILSILSLLNKYGKNILLIFVLNIAFFVTIYALRLPVFKTEMIVSSSVITSERVSIIIDPLGKLAREENYRELAALMNLDTNITSHIEDITAKELRDETKTLTDNYEGEILRQQNCLVVLKVTKNKSLADTIQAGIVHYLRNNEFVRRRSEIDRQNLDFMKIRIQREIKELDILKDKISQQKTGFSMMDPSAINNSIANLYGQELAINLKMQLEDRGINIIRNITNFKSPIAPKLWLFLVAGILSSFFMSVFIILVIEIKEFSRSSL